MSNVVRACLHSLQWTSSLILLYPLSRFKVDLVQCKSNSACAVSQGERGWFWGSWNHTCHTFCCRNKIHIKKSLSILSHFGQFFPILRTWSRPWRPGAIGSRWWPQLCEEEHWGVTRPADCRDKLQTKTAKPRHIPLPSLQACVDETWKLRLRMYKV